MLKNRPVYFFLSTCICVLKNSRQCGKENAKNFVRRWRNMNIRSFKGILPSPWKHWKRGYRYSTIIPTWTTCCNFIIYTFRSILWVSQVWECMCGLPLQHCLPLPQSLSDGKAGNHAMDLGSPLAHVILNVEDKRLLAEVSVYDLTWCLQTHSGVQIWLEDTAGQAHKFSKISVF